MSIPPAGVALPDPALLEGVIITHKLRHRPYRGPNYELENRALVELMRTLATEPERVLQKVAERALELCRAESAGISIEEGRAPESVFRWKAVTGAWGGMLGSTLPRWFSPCGTVLERNEPVLMTDVVQAFPAAAALSPAISEVLLVPFRTARGESVGTVWIVSHTPARVFDREDLRLTESLAAFAGAAYTAMGDRMMPGA